MHKPNKIILKLISIDFLLYGGWGFILPILAIFITREVTGGTLATVGFVVATYWITKSTLQPFFAHSMDKVIGEQDDMSFLLKGIIMVTIVPFLYIFVTQVWQIFILEALRGVAMALVTPAWFGIFTRHIDKNWEAYTWSLQSTALGYTAGIAAIFGGTIASFMGFRVIFVIIFIFYLIATSIIIRMKKNINSNGELAS